MLWRMVSFVAARSLSVTVIESAFFPSRFVHESHHCCDKARRVGAVSVRDLSHTHGTSRVQCRRGTEREKGAAAPPPPPGARRTRAHPHELERLRLLLVVVPRLHHHEDRRHDRLGRRPGLVPAGKRPVLPVRLQVSALVEDGGVRGHGAEVEPHGLVDEGEPLAAEREGRLGAALSQLRHVDGPLGEWGAGGGSRGEMAERVRIST